MTSTDHSRPPLFRRLWVVVLLTCLLITMPVALVILLTGQVYRRIPDGYVPVGKGAHRLYAGFLVLWLVLATLRVLLQPGGFKQEWANSADSDLLKSAASQRASVQPQAPPADAKVSQPVANSANDLPTCDSPEATEAVKGAIEEGAAAKLVNVKVQDYGRATETFYEREKNVRHCAAEAVLNTGATNVTFQIFQGPSGKQMVQAQTGEAADQQSSVDEQMREQQVALNDVRADDTDVRDQYSANYAECMANAGGSAEHNDQAVECIKAESALQDLRLREKLDSKMNSASPDQAQSYKTQEDSWADRITTACHANSFAGRPSNPVTEERCMLTATIRHLREM